LSRRWRGFRLKRWLAQWRRSVTSMASQNSQSPKATLRKCDCSHLPKLCASVCQKMNRATVYHGLRPWGFKVLASSQGVGEYGCYYNRGLRPRLLKVLPSRQISIVFTLAEGHFILTHPKRLPRGQDA
jgi:hypothetical protein